MTEAGAIVSRGRTGGSHAAALLRSAGLTPEGPVPWSRPVPSGKPGVYVVELHDALASAPLDETVLLDWLHRFPTLTVDSKATTFEALRTRLRGFWLPSRRIIYVGKAGGSLHERVNAYYSTPLGNRGPHRGGYWVKLICDRDRLAVWWAQVPEAAAPMAGNPAEWWERRVLEAFAATVPAAEVAALYDRTYVLPFANL